MSQSRSSGSKSSNFKLSLQLEETEDRAESLIIDLENQADRLRGVELMLEDSFDFIERLETYCKNVPLLIRVPEKG